MEADTSLPVTSEITVSSSLCNYHRTHQNTLEITYGTRADNHLKNSQYLVMS